MFLQRKTNKLWESKARKEVAVAVAGGRIKSQDPRGKKNTEKIEKLSKERALDRLSLCLAQSGRNLPTYPGPWFLTSDSHELQEPLKMLIMRRHSPAAG